MSENRDNDIFGSSSDYDFTLESILAEFKGSAYIAGDKKTEPEVLEERTNRIIDEIKDGTVATTELSSKSADGDNDFFADIRVPYGEKQVQEEKSKAPEPPYKEDKSKQKIEPQTKDADEEPDLSGKTIPFTPDVIRMAAKKKNSGKTITESFADQESEHAEYAPRKKRHFFSSDNVTEETENLAGNDKIVPEAENSDKAKREEEKKDGRDILIFDNYRFASDLDKKSEEEYGEEEYYDDEEFKPGLFSRLFSSRKRNRQEPEFIEDEESAPIFEPEAEPEVYIEEPDFKDAAAEYVSRRKFLKLRALISMVIALIMGVAALLFENGVQLPGIGDSVKNLTILLVLLQLIVMLLCVRILVRGVMDIVKLKPSGESLVAFSAAVTYISCLWCIIRGGENMGAPFCAIPAFAAAFAMWSEYRQLAAMALSLKSAAFSSAPTGLSCEFSESIETTLVKKLSGEPEGFYNNLVQEDMAESSYKTFAPFLIFASVLLGVVAAIRSECSFIYCFSAVSAATAAFSALGVFAIPFSIAARKARAAGGAIAGWGGADEIYYADGVRITDKDLFPTGTNISSVKIFENVSSDKVIRYTASLIMASGSGLSDIFSEFLKKQSLAMVKVEDFNCLEGGISAKIRGEEVICGSAACMSLVGIRVPQNLNMKNAVFTSINNTLVGVFAINYVPSKSVQKALNALIKSGMTLYFAVKDFNITPLMVQQKFQIPVEDIEYLPAKETYEMFKPKENRVPHASGVIGRDSLASVAEVVAGARRLRRITFLNTVISILSCVLGMVIMFFMCWNGTASSVSPTNLLEYMLIMEVVTILTSIIAGFNK